MKLTQIDILKYKSIKSLVTVYFNEGEVVTLIGKNGSGKTNVLEAIKFAMAINRNYRTEKIDSEIKYHIELTDEEIKDYFSCVQSENISKEIIVEFNGENPEVRKIQAPLLEFDAENFKLRLDDILKNYKESAHKYLKSLKEIESSDSYFGSYLDVHVEGGNKGSIFKLTSTYIDQTESNIKNQINEIKKYIQQIFKDNKIYLNQYDHPYSSISHLWDISFYRIPEDEEIKISPIVAKSLNISKKDLDKANEKLNRRLKEINNLLEGEYKNIQTQLDEFDKIKKEIAAIFDAKSEEIYEQQEQTNKLFETVMQKLRKAVFRNCYYIDNENSIIFYNSVNREYRNEYTNQEYLNSRNPILEAFDNFLRVKGIIDEKSSISQKDKLEECQIKKAIRALNSEFLINLMPEFENGEILKFEVKYDNGSFNLYVHEKNGDVVSFNSTSLGRRWYLTYQFVKALLKPGDLLLVDEPAAFLHPQAQTEFKKELEMLAQNGIGVFYSTHSPYMIPEDWGQVYNVTMTSDGTQVVKFETSDELCETIKSELGASATSDILFNLSKTILLVEGIADKICIEKFAELLNYNLSDYHIHVCDGEAILQIAYLCLKNKMIKVKVVLDNDNKYKNDYFIRSHSMYSECIDMINANLDCCAYIGKGERGCLEDLFVEKDDKFKYYNRQKAQKKVNVKAVSSLKSISDVSEQTKANFEQLFKQLGIPKLDESKR